MGIALIVVGLFLWFALAFNGSVGTQLVNYSFFGSALLMMITGVLTIVKSKSVIARHFCIAALLCYLPMIWQRFSFKSHIDWAGFYFDIAIVSLMLIFIIKSQTTRSGAAREKAPRTL